MRRTENALNTLIKPCFPQLMLMLLLFVFGCLLGVCISRNPELSFKLGLFTTADAHLFGSFSDLLIDSVKMYSLAFALSLGLLATGVMPILVGWYGFCISYSTALYFCGRGAIPLVAVASLLPKIIISAPLFILFCASGTHFSLVMAKGLCGKERSSDFQLRLLRLLLLLVVSFALTAFSCYIQALLIKLI